MSNLSSTTFWLIFCSVNLFCYSSYSSYLALFYFKTMFVNCKLLCSNCFILPSTTLFKKMKLAFSASSLQRKSLKKQILNNSLGWLRDRMWRMIWHSCGNSSSILVRNVSFILKREGTLPGTFIECGTF